MNSNNWLVIGFYKLINFGLIALGIHLCIIPILLTPILIILKKVVKPTNQRPWNKGLLLNILTAYLRYDLKSWLIRIKSIVKYPDLTIQYLNILLNKQELKFISIQKIPINLTVPQHKVRTNHKHHRERVNALKTKKLTIDQLTSYSPIIVVKTALHIDFYIIHDGHHRIAAAKEAGLTHINALVYERI